MVKSCLKLPGDIGYEGTSSRSVITTENVIEVSENGRRGGGKKGEFYFYSCTTKEYDGLSVNPCRSFLG
jgi:hypothetical protein